MVVKLPSKPLKIIIAGGREFKPSSYHVKKLYKILQDFGEFEAVSGGARGADAFGEYIVKRLFNKTPTLFPAQWNEFGKVAGRIRNSQMANYADMLIAFKGGNGTAHMIQCMQKLNKPVILIEEEDSKGLF